MLAKVNIIDPHDNTTRALAVVPAIRTNCDHLKVLLSAGSAFAIHLRLNARPSRTFIPTGHDPARQEQRGVSLNTILVMSNGIL